MLQAPPLSGRNLLLLKALIIGIRTQTLWPGFRDVTDHSIKNFENVFLLKPFFHLLKINGSFLSFRKKTIYSLFVFCFRCRLGFCCSLGTQSPLLYLLSHQRNQLKRHFTSCLILLSSSSIKVRAALTLMYCIQAYLHNIALSLSLSFSLSHSLSHTHKCTHTHTLSLSLSQRLNQ